MKKTYLALALAGTTLLCSPAFADDYRVEVGAGYYIYNNDTAPNDSAIEVDARYNFRTVSTDNVPLAEAEFLGRNGGVDLSYYTQDKEDNDTYSASINNWFNDLYLAASFSLNDDGTDKNKDFSVTGGYMISDDLRLHLQVENGDSYDKTNIAVGLKHVGRLWGHYVNLETEFAVEDDVRTLAAAGDWFVNNRFSVGASAATTNTNNFFMPLELNAKYFILPNVSGEVSIGDTLTSSGLDKNSTVHLRLAARF